MFIIVFFSFMERFVIYFQQNEFDFIATKMNQPNLTKIIITKGC